jgi:uncharacterized RDD family membrane protein YckC
MVAGHFGRHRRNYCPDPSANIIRWLMSESHKFGFVRRRAATLVDLLLSGVLLCGVMFVNHAFLQDIYLHPTTELKAWMAQRQVGAFGGNSNLLNRNFPDIPNDLRSEFLELSKASTIVFWALALLGLWLYHAVLESKLNTPGKLLAGLVVRDRNGQRISIRRATIRLLGKILLVCGLTLLFGVPLFLGLSYVMPEEYNGFALAATGGILFLLGSIRFTKNTATFYDALAGCIVARKGEYGLG